jgi:hypothetical protein
MRTNAYVRIHERTLVIAPEKASFSPRLQIGAKMGLSFRPPTVAKALRFCCGQLRCNSKLQCDYSFPAHCAYRSLSSALSATLTGVKENKFCIDVIIGVASSSPIVSGELWARICRSSRETCISAIKLVRIDCSETRIARIMCKHWTHTAGGSVAVNNV